MYPVDAAASVTATLSLQTASATGRRVIDEGRQERAAAAVDVATSTLLGLRDQIAGEGTSITGAVLGLDLSEVDEVVTVTEPPDPEGTVTPTEPEWAPRSGRSLVRATSAVTISGSYNGEHSTTMTFMAHRSREVGDPDHQVKLDVFDADGEELGMLEWDWGAAPGTPFETEWGFSITLGEGKISYGETFELTLTAADDAAELLAQEPEEVTESVARVSDLEAPMAEVLPVEPGTVSVNGHVIAIDPTTDSLQDVLDWMAETGVSARYDTAADAVVIESATAVTLEDDRTGLWAALGVEPGTYAPDTELDKDTAKAVASAVVELDEQLSRLVDARGTNREIRAWRTHRSTGLNTFLEGATGEVSVYKLSQLARNEPLALIDAYLGSAESGGFGGFVGDLLDLLALPRVETVA